LLGQYLPIRFNYLDTELGTNLSVQVHPPTSSIRTFGEPIGQHETYYTVEAMPGSLVHLGLQASPTRKQEFLEDVKKAEKSGVEFPPSEHVQAFPSREGDLFLIPAGTVHCSGSGNLVLEISTTPYLYTFKLYDYLRLGSDGARRPISYEAGFKVLRGERQGDFVKDRLVMRGKETLRTCGKGWRRMLLSNGERLMPQEIERLELRVGHEKVVWRTERTGFLMLALTKGMGCAITGLNGGQRRLNYAECCIVPWASGGFTVEALGEIGAETHLVVTYIRAPGVFGADHLLPTGPATKKWSVGIDAGGTNVKHGLVCEWLQDEREWIEVVGRVESTDAGSQGGKDAILRSFAGIIEARVQAIEPSPEDVGVAFSFPGPMDYAAGTPDIGSELGGKYGTLSGVRLPEALEPLLQTGVRYEWKFTNDATCAGLASESGGKTIAITLGTGLGSCFIENGKLQTGGEGVSEDGWIYSGLVDTQGWIERPDPLVAAWGKVLESRSKGTVIADDVWSVRGLAGLLRSAGVDAGTDAELVKSGAGTEDELVKIVVDVFASTLGDFLAPYVDAFGADKLLVLGGIGEGYWDSGLEAGLRAKLACVVEKGRLGRAAGVLGAVMAARSSN
jgi:predicted NBD/HSP70 family sugar kinase